MVRPARVVFPVPPFPEKASTKAILHYTSVAKIHLMKENTIMNKLRTYLKIDNLAKNPSPPRKRGSTESPGKHGFPPARE